MMTFYACQKQSSVITPRGIRIPVTSVKGRCPRPLDDGGVINHYTHPVMYLIVTFNVKL